MWTVRENEGRWLVIAPEAGGIVDSAHWLSRASADQRCDTLLRSRSDQEALTAAAGDSAEGRPFYSVLCVDEYEAADGRYFEHFDWSPLPLALWTLDSNEGGGHYGAESSGSIRTIERLSDGRRIFATGFLTTTDEGEQTAAQIESQALRFVSVDPADYEMEEEITKIGSDGWPIDGRLRFTSYTIGGATVLGNPAIRLACIWLEGMDAPAELTMPLPDPVDRVQIPEIVDVDDEDSIIVIMASATGEEPEPADSAALMADTRELRALLASARAERFGEGSCILTNSCGGPALPPEEWFSAPALSGPTPLEVTQEGELVGHVALWNTPHRGFLHYEMSERIYAPRSSSGYREFLVHTTPVACCAEHATCGHERTAVRTGVLTVGTSHAGSRLSAVMAQAHYENSGLQAADVTCGEDEHGIWIHGALRPGLDDARVREVLGSSPSGDWRWIGGQLELCAVLGVNSGGFPITASSHVEDGVVRSLIAGGLPPSEPDEALVASLARRRPLQGAQAQARLPEGVVVVERARLERLERDVETLRPLVADRIAAETEALLTA